MGWIGFSLIQGAGRPALHSRERRFRNTAPCFTQLSSMSASGLLSDIDAVPLMPNDPKRTFRGCRAAVASASSAWP